jgi:hypothetical protein
MLTLTKYRAELDQFSILEKILLVPVAIKVPTLVAVRPD